MPETNARIKVCHDTAANFKTNNPTLLVGEWALETDTKKMKIGDGTTPYNSLQYSTAEESEEWQKPADWVDIRSGALPNSIYFLVGHSADYAKYPTFQVQPTVSNSGTYDVFVDGIKVATTASNTATVLDWQTLALQTGWSVAYPEALLTHIVRITPTLSANQFTKIGSASTTSLAGLLWAHLTISYSVNAEYAFYYAKVLEAVSVANDRLLVSNLAHAFHEDYALKELPVLDGNNTAVGYASAFRNAHSIKQLTLKNMKCTSGLYSFLGCNLLKKVVCENASFEYYTQTFNGCNALQEMPVMDPASTTGANGILTGCTSLHAMLLDFQNATGLTSIQVGGSATNRIDGVKGLIVSNQAPLDGTSPQINVAYTGLGKGALVNLFKSMPYNVGYTVVGSPTIVDGVASGFSTDDYPRTSAVFNPGNNPWEIGTEIKITQFTTAQTIIGRVTDNVRNLQVGLNSSGKMRLFLASSNQSWNIANNIISTLNISLNTDYYIRLKFTGTQYLLDVSTDGSNWTNYISVDSTAAITHNGYISFGRNSPAYPEILQGMIDLNNTYIKVNGIPWFRGTAAMTKTCNIVGCTGTAELTQDDKNIALNKGWELTVA